MRHAISRLKLALAATRPQFLTASVLPVMIGTAWGWRVAGRLDLAAALLAMVATALVHAASNVYNDVSDEVHGTDRANAAAIRPFTGGSGFIQDGTISLQDMQRLAFLLGLMATGSGLLLALLQGPGVLVFGIAGAVLGVAYSLPGVRLSGRGLGEMVIATAFGILPVCGAAWLQTDLLHKDALLLALPVSAWVAAIIIANEIPDAPADAATDKHTLAVRLGSRTPRLYLAIQAAGFLAAIAVLAHGLLPAWTLLAPLLLLVLALVAARALAGDRAGLKRGIRLTLLIHAAGSAWLLAGIGFAVSIQQRAILN